MSMTREEKISALVKCIDGYDLDTLLGIVKECTYDYYCSATGKEIDADYALFVSNDEEVPND